MRVNRLNFWGLALLGMVSAGVAAPGAAPAQQAQPAQAQPAPSQPAQPRPAQRAPQNSSQSQSAAQGGGSAGGAAPPPTAPATPAAPAAASGGLQILDRGWRVVCQSPANNRNLMQCNVIFEAFRDNGQRLLAIELIREGGDQRVLLTTPLGVNLVAPVEVVIDRGPPLRAAYQTCQTAGCVALAPRGVDPVSLGRAGEMEVRFETGGQKIGIPIPLAGFTAAMKRAE